MPATVFVAFTNAPNTEAIARKVKMLGERISGSADHSADSSWTDREVSGNHPH